MSIPVIDERISASGFVEVDVGSNGIFKVVSGGTFIPHISEEGILSWENNKGYENPEPVKVLGENGITPHIGENGNWFLGETDTGISGKGAQISVDYTEEGTYVHVIQPDGTNEVVMLKNGKDGTNGASPVIEVTEIEGGHRLTIHDISGKKTVDIFDGTNGEDGFSPAVEVTKIEGGHRITVTDKNGAQNFEVMDGKDGVVPEEVNERIETLEEQMAELLYVPIAVDSFTHNAGNRENGEVVTSVLLSWKINKEPVSVKVDGEAVTAAKNGSVIIDGNYTANKTFTIAATDERGNTATKTATIGFYDGIYYGMAEEPGSLDSGFINGLEKILSSSKNRTVSVTGDEGKYFWYAYPAAMGTSIFNIGGFDYEYGYENISFTNKFGVVKNYIVYRSTQPIKSNVSVTVKGG